MTRPGPLVVVPALLGIAATLFLLLGRGLDPHPAGPEPDPGQSGLAPADPPPPSPVAVRRRAADAAGFVLRYLGYVHEPERPATLLCYPDSVRADPRWTAMPPAGAEPPAEWLRELLRRHPREEWRALALLVADEAGVLHTSALAPGSYRAVLLQPVGRADAFAFTVTDTPVRLERPYPALTGPPLRLSGHVRDQRSQQGLAGAEIAVFPPWVPRTELDGAAPAAAVASARDGSYTLELAVAGRPLHFVRARAPDYLAAVRLLEDSALGADAAARAFDLQLVPSADAAVVRGSVVDANQRPLPARARLLHEAGRQAGWYTLHGADREARCDGAGRFVLDAIPPGPHLLAVQCDGHATWTRHLELAARSATDLGTIVLAAAAGETAAPATFVGSIAAPDAAPIAGAEVTVREQSTRAHTVRTDADGRFTGAVPAGRHRVEVRAEGWPEAMQPMEFPAGEVVTFHYRFPSGRHFLGGLVVATVDGRALAGIDAEVRVRDGAGGPALRVRGRTDADGRFRLAGIPDGQTALLLEWHDPYTDLLVADVTVDRDDQRFAFPFPDAVRVHGTVRDGHGSPVAGATVATDAGGSPRRTTTAADGSYAVAVPMTWQQAQRFLVHAPGYANTTTYFLREDGGPDADILWNPVLHGDADLATIAGTVSGARGEPLAAVQVELRAAGEGSRSGMLEATTDSRGAYRIAGVPPGRHEIAFRAAGCCELRVAVTVSARDELRRDVTLAPAPLGDVELVLVDAHGTGMAGVRWQAHAFHPSRSAQGTTGADGLVRLPGWPLVAGRVDLGTAASLPDYQVELAHHDAPPPAQRLVLRGGELAVRGRVLGARGQPAPHLGITLAEPATGGLRLWEYATTDANGQFAFTNLPAGEYRCAVDSVQDVSAVVRAGGPPVELRLGW